MDMFAVNAGVVNGGALNGASIPVRTATVAISATANITALSTKIVSADVSIVCLASLSPTSTQLAGALAQIDGTAFVGFKPFMVQAGRAAIYCASDVTASVIRIVDAIAVIDCSAELIVVPASTFGGVLIQGFATIAAGATKVQPGYVSAYCAATVSAVSVANRKVSATINGTAELRPESQVNNLQDGYAFINCYGDVAVNDVGSVIKVSTANIYCTADISTKISYIHSNAKVDIIATAELVAVAENKVGTGADILGTASVSVIGTRITSASLNIGGTADISVLPAQRHVVTAAISCVAEISVQNILTQSATTEIAGTAEVIALPVRTRMSKAVVDATADVIVLSAYQAHAATADVRGTADTTAVGTLTVFGGTNITGTATIYTFPSAVQQAMASIDAKADVAAVPFLYQQATSAVDGTAVIYVLPLVTQFAGAVIEGDAYIYTDARTNAEATDPFERTMFRPYVDSLMFRPYVDTVMRRAA